MCQRAAIRLLEKAIPSLVESSSVNPTLLRLLLGKIIIFLNLSSSIFRGRGWTHFFRRSLPADIYDSLRIGAIGQAIGSRVHGHLKHRVDNLSYNSMYWFKSYLENRTQLCSINGSLSNNRSLTCGVPQGTILGPLLFLLYINDLPNCLSNCEPRMYADDTHLTYAGDCVDNLQLYLNQDLDNVHNWLRANKLTLNMTKTEFMLIGSR